MCFLREMRRSLQNGCGCDKTPNHGECIRCGMCVRACPTGAVCFRYGFGDGKEAANETTKKTTKKTNMEESK